MICKQSTPHDVILNQRLNPTSSNLTASQDDGDCCGRIQEGLRNEPGLLSQKPCPHGKQCKICITWPFTPPHLLERLAIVVFRPIEASETDTRKVFGFWQPYAKSWRVETPSSGSDSPYELIVFVEMDKVGDFAKACAALSEEQNKRMEDDLKNYAKLPPVFWTQERKGSGAA